MFKKLGRALSSQKTRIKVRYDVQIVNLQGLPAGVSACRVVWARAAKVQYTRLAAVTDGERWQAACPQLHASASTEGVPRRRCRARKQELSIIATLDKDGKGKYEPKVRCGELLCTPAQALQRPCPHRQRSRALAPPFAADV